MNKELIWWHFKKCAVLSIVVSTLLCFLFLVCHDEFYFQSSDFFIIPLGLLGYDAFEKVMDVRGECSVFLLTRYDRNELFKTRLMALLLVFLVAVLPLILIILFSFISGINIAMLDFFDLSKSQVFGEILYNSLVFWLIGCTSVFWFPKLKSRHFRTGLFVVFVVLSHNLKVHETGEPLTNYVCAVSPFMMILTVAALIYQMKQGEVK
jgi:hypothetical protein